MAVSVSAMLVDTHQKISLKFLFLSDIFSDCIFKSFVDALMSVCRKSFDRLVSTAIVLLLYSLLNILLIVEVLKSVNVMNVEHTL